MAFVENFRRFTKIPAPQKAPFEVRELLEHAMTLIATEGIRIRLDVEPGGHDDLCRPDAGRTKWW